MLRGEISDLGKIANARIAGEGDMALIGLFATGQDIEDSRLASTIRPNEADAIVLIDLKANPRKDTFCPERFPQVDTTHNRHVDFTHSLAYENWLDIVYYILFGIEYHTTVIPASQQKHRVSFILNNRKHARVRAR
jgi:hypothetical protein